MGHTAAATVYSLTVYTCPGLQQWSMSVGFKSVVVDKSPKVYTQLAREGVVLTQDSDNI